MNFYIDFDNTLFETSRLSKDMVMEISKSICDKYSEKDIDDAYEEVKAMFNRENIYNIYNLARFFAEKYKLDAEKMIQHIEDIISNGEEYVYKDTTPFLKLLKKDGNTINILTYVAQEDLSYQLSKIKGSGLSKYFDNIFIVSKNKFDLDLKYEEGIFIDDSPKDLKGLATKNVKKLIRIRRESNKYSKEDVKIESMVEYKSFDEIDLKKEMR